MLKSNIAACHLKLEQWRDAVDTATAALDGLDKLERTEAGSGAAGPDGHETLENDEDVEEEIVSTGASKAGPALPKQQTEAEISRLKKQEDIARIRAKALMRRGRARSELGGWTNLEGAIGDYKKLAAVQTLSPSDKRIVQAQLRILPPRAKAAQEKETAEMWDKLKDLGNGILKPFGLSTENFKMVKDEKSGGYSMNFQGGGSSDSK